MIVRSDMIVTAMTKTERERVWLSAISSSAVAAPALYSHFIFTASEANLWEKLDIHQNPQEKQISPCFQNEY